MIRTILTAAVMLLGGVLSGCAVLPPDPPARPSAPPARQAPAVVQGTQVPAPAPAPRVEAPVQRVDPARVETRMNESEQVSNLISHVQSIAAQPPEGQRREVQALNQGLARDTGMLPRLRLALLLSLPGTAVNDDARALALLEPLVAGGALANAGALQRFATLVHGQVAERVREQRRATQLREQLDALKAMERSLLQRGQGRIR